jgi:hypothetical protein
MLMRNLNFIITNLKERKILYVQSPKLNISNEVIKKFN